jgi:hypothetical protein
MKRNGPGDAELAVELCRRATRRIRPISLPDFLTGLAWIPLKTGRARDAARIAGAALLLMAEHNERSEAKVFFQELHAALLAELPKTELAKLFDQGAKLTRDEAFALGLDRQRADV